MNWTDERVELLKKLWSEGLSASQIAAQLGGVSRNAVIGKVHRLKLSGRGKTTKAAPRNKKAAPAQTPRSTREETVQPAPDAVASPEPSPAPLPSSSAAAQHTIDKNSAKGADKALGAIDNDAVAKDAVAKDAVAKDAVAKNAVDDAEMHPEQESAVPKSRNLSLLQLSETTCKWPVGDPLSEDFYFCGADSGESGPYCRYHAKLAYQPVSDRRRKAS